jgi:hypothetical protein
VFCRFISDRSRGSKVTKHLHYTNRRKNTAEMTEQSRHGGKRKRKVAAADFNLRF